MAVDERRRSELYARLEAALGPDAAATMFEMMPKPEMELATRSDLASLRTEFERRFDQVDARFEHVDARFESLWERIDERFATQDIRFDELESRLTAVFERRITDAVTTQTRTLVFSQLGAVVTIAALAFGLR